MSRWTERIEHVPQLDGVRAVSILCVIAGHALPIGLSSWGLNPAVANAGLALFFVLSGFLIVSFLQAGQGVGDFLVRRAARIVPAFYLYIATAGLLLNWDVSVALANLTFVANYGALGPTPGAMHLWSICVEVHFYLGIALVVALFGRRGLWLILPAAVVVTGARIAADAPFSYLTHYRADEILAGGLLALGAARLRPWLSSLGQRAALGLGAVLVAGLVAASSPEVPVLPYARPYLAAALVALCMFAPLGAVTRALISQPAAFVARISYALYLYHWSLLLIVFDGGGAAMRYLLWRPLGLVVLGVVAHGSTDMWEGPWQRLARRITAVPRRTPRIPAE